MTKVLIITGPTATGKTALALRLAQEFNGELVSADSRQVYVGKDIVTGKDIPPGYYKTKSNLFWSGRFLDYYTDGQTRIWLTDVVSPGEKFNVSFWHTCAQLVISDILNRSKLPIIVGVTGLYIKSLFNNLSNIIIPSDDKLRNKLSDKSANYLFNYLKKINPVKANRLNDSDRLNPRRLIRAVELSFAKVNLQPTTYNLQLTTHNYFQIALNAPLSELFRRIDARVVSRIAAGAVSEDPQLAADPPKWQRLEHGQARRQLTWFKKQPNLHWFDITVPDWDSRLKNIVSAWYTNP